MTGNRVKGKPAVLRKIHLRHCIGISVTDDVQTSERIKPTWTKTRHQPRWNANGTQHHREGSGKVVWIASFVLEQESLH